MDITVACQKAELVKLIIDAEETKHPRLYDFSILRFYKRFNFGYDIDKYFTKKVANYTIRIPNERFD